MSIVKNIFDGIEVEVTNLTSVIGGKYSQLSRWVTYDLYDDQVNLRFDFQWYKNHNYEACSDYLLVRLICSLAHKGDHCCRREYLSRKMIVQRTYDNILDIILSEQKLVYREKKYYSFDFKSSREGFWFYFSLGSTAKVGIPGSLFSDEFKLNRDQFREKPSQELREKLIELLSEEVGEKVLGIYYKGENVKNKFNQ